MPPTKQSPRDSDPDNAGNRQLMEALAGGNPIPDTSTICPDKRQLITLLAEITKGERSALWLMIRQVAERRGLAPHEIASRAAFLLACLDSPGTDDPYTILGVAPTATNDEIKEAWLSRLTVYHPDRHPENSEWFTRQAARLNEAYHVLKDPARRHAYDERRRREFLAREQCTSIGMPPGSSAPPAASPQPSRPTGRRIPVLVTVSSIAAAGLLLLALSDRDAPRPQLYLRTVPPVAAVGLPPVVPTAKRHPVKLRLGQVASRPSSLTTPSDHQSERRPTRVSQDPLPLDAHASGPGSSDDPTISAQPLDHSVQLAQALPPITPEPKALDRQEIDALLDEYVDAYEKADVERVMAVLSTRVREKGTLDYQAIRNAYIKGFAGRDQIIYRLKNVQVEIKDEQATVTAQYLISARNGAHSAKATTVSGRIEWKIRRESERLKIVAINY